MTTITTKTSITVRTSICAPVEKVWNLWTDPKHIMHWNNASPDWHTPRAENDLRVGGKFLSRMEARDGSLGFDFVGVYTRIVHHKRIEYTLEDDRKVRVSFLSDGNGTHVTETFEAERDNSLELQQGGWQAILDNFKKYVETSSGNFETMHFEITINAPVEKVYQSMLDENKWKEWTSAFNASSYFEGSWEKGSKIRFIGVDKDGNMGGISSKIIENIPNKLVSIEHLREIKDGIEITAVNQSESWAGAMEIYSFSELNGKTKLTVDVDTFSKFKSYFSDTWPKALENLKTICEFL